MAARRDMSSVYRIVLGRTRHNAVARYACRNCGSYFGSQLALASHHKVCGGSGQPKCDMSTKVVVTWWEQPTRKHKTGEDPKAFKAVQHKLKQDDRVQWHVEPGTS